MMKGDSSSASRTITELTRRDIMDKLAMDDLNGQAVGGRLDEVAFLNRIFDLKNMPSTDYRFKNAEGDIHQHRINNLDWECDWFFHDPRFNLLRCEDSLFARFLEELVHPVVRTPEEEARRLVSLLNESLVGDGWELAETSQLSGRPVFTARRRGGHRVPSEGLEVDRYERFQDPQVLREHLSRIERDLQSDPPGAIAASKELVESVCKAILDDYGVEYAKGAELGDLYKLVQTQLNLSATAVAGSKKGSEAAVKTLRALVTTIQSLAELRNELGTGHGRSQLSAALTRHARLAFNSSVAICEFLLDTWHERRAAEAS